MKTAEESKVFRFVLTSIHVRSHYFVRGLGQKERNGRTKGKDILNCDLWDKVCFGWPKGACI